LAACRADRPNFLFPKLDKPLPGFISLEINDVREVNRNCDEVRLSATGQIIASATADRWPFYAFPWPLTHSIYPLATIFHVKEQGAESAT